MDNADPLSYLAQYARECPCEASPPDRCASCRGDNDGNRLDHYRCESCNGDGTVRPFGALMQLCPNYKPSIEGRIDVPCLYCGSTHMEGIRGVVLITENVFETLERALLDGGYAAVIMMTSPSVTAKIWPVMHPSKLFGGKGPDSTTAMLEAAVQMVQSMAETAPSVHGGAAEGAE